MFPPLCSRQKKKISLRTSFDSLSNKSKNQFSRFLNDKNTCYGSTIYVPALFISSLRLRWRHSCFEIVFFQHQKQQIITVVWCLCVFCSFVSFLFLDASDSTSYCWKLGGRSSLANHLCIFVSDVNDPQRMNPINSSTVVEMLNRYSWSSCDSF